MQNEISGAIQQTFPHGTYRLPPRGARTNFRSPVSPATLTEMPKVVIDETEYGLTLMGRRNLAQL